MGTGIKDPPYNQPMVERDGRLSSLWRSFFKELMVRVGGTQALSNQELAELPALELAALEARVTSTESDIAAIQTVNTSQTTTITTHTTQINDLGQGPVL